MKTKSLSLLEGTYQMETLRIGNFKSWKDWIDNINIKFSVREFI
jgi:hypothetical protein